MIVTLALAAFERDKTKPKHPILFLLEEFPALGHFKEIETAAGLLAGYGIKLWMIVQDLSQLKVLYAEAWETFLANAGVVQAFAVSGQSTLVHLSDLLGATTFWQESISDRSLEQRRQGASGESRGQITNPLANPRELADLLGREDPSKPQEEREKKGNQLLLPAGEAPRIIHLLKHERVKDIKDGTLDEVKAIRGRAT